MQVFITPKDTQSRDWVANHAQSNPVEALQVAGAITDPWLRCQAFAHAALHARDQAQRMQVLGAAFASAHELKEPNRIVKVSAWPLKILCIHKEVEELERQTERLLEIISTEPHPVRRADALFEMLGALAIGPKQSFLEALSPFEQACQTIRGSKGDWMLRHIFPVLERVDSTRAANLLEMIERPTQKALAIEESERQRTRSLEQICSWPSIGHHSPSN